MHPFGENRSENPRRRNERIAEREKRGQGERRARERCGSVAGGGVEMY